MLSRMIMLILLLTTAVYSFASHYPISSCGLLGSLLFVVTFPPTPFRLEWTTSGGHCCEIWGCNYTFVQQAAHLGRATLRQGCIGLQPYLSSSRFLSGSPNLIPTLTTAWRRRCTTHKNCWGKERPNVDLLDWNWMIAHTTFHWRAKAYLCIPL